MNYKDGEILAEELIQSVGGFTSTNTGRGTKWRLLNSGASDHYAVLRKGAHVETFITPRLKSCQYKTVVEVLQRVRDGLEDRYDDLLDNANAIRVKLDAHYKLADSTHSIQDANITGMSEVKEIWMERGTVLAWIMVEVYLDWSADEEITVTSQ